MRPGTRRPQHGRWARTVAGLWIGCLTAGVSGAATPPALVNYQGVLRSSAGAPLTGSYDMVFRLFDAATDGNEILVDRHLASGDNAVSATGGMFSTQIGGGSVDDGAGPGTYTSVAVVFRDYDAVWLDITVNGETMSPRVRVAADAYALNASNLEGKPAASFIDTTTTEQVKYGPLDVVASDPSTVGLQGVGSFAGGLFQSLSSSGYAYLGYGDYGISAYGDGGAGLFYEGIGPGRAYLATGGIGVSATGVRGVDADGTDAGGHFRDLDGSGESWVGYGDYGIFAKGGTAGGEFHDANGSGYAIAGVGDTGLTAAGNATGGFFSDLDGSGVAWVGNGDYGILARGNNSGGLFQDLNGSGYARAGDGDYGISAFGNTTGAYFADLNSSGLAYVGFGDRGIWAKGTFAGGTFSHPDNVTFWADVATPTRKIQGTGTVSFVQNHPYEKDKVIAYAAPEGDEVAVYTRGTARLINGEARVKLGDTFEWVANPEIGLTAHLTPRGEAVPLAVAGLSTEEMLVKGPAGSDCAFDYIVYGLRIGFEDLPIVQPKDREAFLPSAEDVEAPYQQAPALRSLSAGERFKAMQPAAGIGLTPSSLHARDLAGAINEGREQVVAQARQRAQPARPPQQQPATVAVVSSPATPSHLPASPSSPAVAGETRPAGGASPASVAATVPAEPGTSRYPLLPVTGAEEPGDVLVMDPDDAGTLRASSSAVDATVAGCAVQPDEGMELPRGRTAVALSGIALCRADAGYGPIKIGDLLTTSATPGHAMRADAGAAGAILGKAMEPLLAGTALIRVLITLR